MSSYSYEPSRFLGNFVKTNEKGSPLPEPNLLQRIKQYSYTSLSRYDTILKTMYEDVHKKYKTFIRSSLREMCPIKQVGTEVTICGRLSDKLDVIQLDIFNNTGNNDTEVHEYDIIQYSDCLYKMGKCGLLEEPTSKARGIDVFANVMTSYLNAIANTDISTIQLFEGKYSTKVNNYYVEVTAENISKVAGRVENKGAFKAKEITLHITNISTPEKKKSIPLLLYNGTASYYFRYPNKKDEIRDLKTIIELEKL